MNPTTEKSSAVCNAAAMREALDEIRVAAMSDYEWDADYLIERCNAAISAPPRNCDVGTAEEQKKRFQDFCDDSQVDEDYTSMCARCTLRREKHCELAWAQMPYEEGGAK